MIAAAVGIVWLDAWTAAAAPACANGGCPFIALSHHGGPLVLLLGGMLALAAVELARLIGAKGFRPITWVAGTGACLLGLSPWLAVHLGYSADTIALATIVIGLIVIMLAAIWTRPIDGAIGTVATTLLVMLYVGILGSFVVRLRCAWPGPTGAWMVLYFIGVVKVTDIAAYFTGRAIGRRKMAPTLSSVKSIEGLIGGILAATAVAVTLTWSVGIICVEFIDTANVWPGLVKAAGFGVAMAVTGQVGDLFESLLKRDAAAKDSGSSIPGFGGVLDLVDSPLLAAPVAWLILTVL